MKRIIFVILFMLCAGIILANDWRVLSSVNDLTGEIIYLGNVKNGAWIKITIPTQSCEIICEVKAKNKKGNMEVVLADFSQKEKAEFWEVIGEYQKNKCR
jgi:hypothetical protein